MISSERRRSGVVQAACFGMLVVAAIAILRFQSHRIDELTERQHSLQSELSGPDTPAATIPSRLSDTDRRSTGAPSSASVAAPIPIDPHVLLGEVTSAMNAKNKSAAMALIQKHAAAITQADPASLEILLERVGELPTELNLVYVDMITRQLAVDQPRETIEKLIEDVGHKIPYAVLRLEEWAARDPAGAVAWFRERAGQNRSFFHQSLVRGLARKSATDAFDFIATLPPEEQPGGFAILSSEPLSPTDCRKVVVAVADLPSPQRVPIYQSLATGMLHHDSFVAAADLVESLDLSDADRARLARHVALADLPADAAAKGEWLVSQSLQGEKGRNLGALVSGWAERDFNAAGEYLNSIDKNAPHRGLAVAAFAKKIARKEPPTAVDWAATIRYPNVRAKTLQHIYHTWSETNREAADRYFDSKGLARPAAAGGDD